MATHPASHGTNHATDTAPSPGGGGAALDFVPAPTPEQTAGLVLGYPYQAISDAFSATEGIVGKQVGELYVGLLGTAATSTHADGAVGVPASGLYRLNVAGLYQAGPGSSNAGQEVTFQLSTADDQAVIEVPCTPVDGQPLNLPGVEVVRALDVVTAALAAAGYPPLVDGDLWYIAATLTPLLLAA